MILVAPVRAASGCQPLRPLGCAQTVRWLLTEAPAGPLLCAEPAGGMDAHGLVRGQDEPWGDNQHILRAVILDGLAPRGPGATARADLLWEALAQEPSPRGRPSCSGPLFIWMFVLFCCAWLQILLKYIYPLGHCEVSIPFAKHFEVLRRDERVYLFDLSNELDLGFLFCVARRQDTLFS